MIPTKPIPSQQEADMDKPEEHVLWALRNLPSFAGSGVVTHSGFLRGWSKHLWEAGFRHVDWL
ncbi:MAG: phage gene 29 protein family protein, partial [Isosphaeraceae bacterium]